MTQAKHVYTSQFPELTLPRMLKFEGGMFKTDDDALAARLDELIDRRPDLSQAIKKLDMSQYNPEIFQAQPKRDNAVGGQLTSTSGSEEEIRQAELTRHAAGTGGGASSDGSDAKMNPGANFAKALAGAKVGDQK